MYISPPPHGGTDRLWREFEMTMERAGDLSEVLDKAFKLKVCFCVL